MKHFLKNFQIFLIAIFLMQISSAQVVPVKNGNKYKLSVGDVEFEVDASFGARITSFKLGETEMLLQGRDMTGSTLWTSPQDEWGWPPLSATDSDEYLASIEGGKMIFVSDEESGLRGKKFKFIKTFWANESNNSISIRYSLVNTGTSSISTSLWAVSRVEPNGLTFWKAGDEVPWYSGSWTAALLNTIEEEIDFYWMEFDAYNGSNNKFFSGIGGTGWFAHVNNSNVVFIKSFDDVSSSDFAPAEGEFEYYTGGSYIELENQGKYTTVETGDTLHYDVTWYLSQLPDDVPAETGSNELIEFAQGLVDTGGETSVYDYELSAIHVFPNPVHDLLMVDINKGFTKYGLFNLYDISGRLICTEEVYESTQIDVSKLSNGAYFYNIVSDQKTSKGKLIKR